MYHLRIYSVILAVLTALFIGAILNSRFHGNTSEQLKDIHVFFSMLPSADPGMNNSARYIRHLSLSTPGSAFPDYPGQPDYLPGGMMWPPPLFWNKDQKKPLFTPTRLDGKKDSP